MEPKYKKLLEEYEGLERRLAGGALPPAELKEASRRHSELADVVASIRELARLERELTDLDALAADP